MPTGASAGRRPAGNVRICTMMYTCRACTVDDGMTPPLRISKPLTWALIALLTTLVTYVAFRAYLNADFLISFANGFTC